MIEQQWENQLINDAKFTANTQLPSITFDINNSYVSQQLGQRVGEEVSHFYHPPPPPRNPSGFWQRVEQRYKNELERQALIAEGRAAANSEVMSESLGYASANQQHYLDLGYTDSVAQTRAALLAMSEVPSVPIAKGIQTGIKISRLLVENKWGFFGRNEIEKSITHLSPTELEITQPRTMGRKSFAELVRDIKENGINETVKYIKYNGKNYVVDGNHRLVAARTLGLSKILVEKVELPYLGYRTIDDLNFYSLGLSNY